MEFQVELSQTLDKTPACLDGLSELIDLSWIEQALAATGKASIRRRRLPAERVVWLVIGLALFRNQPIWHVGGNLTWYWTRPSRCVCPARQYKAASAWAMSRWHTCSSNSPRPGGRSATTRIRA